MTESTPPNSLIPIETNLPTTDMEHSKESIRKTIQSLCTGRTWLDTGDSKREPQWLSGFNTAASTYWFA